MTDWKQAYRDLLVAVETVPGWLTENGMDPQSVAFVKAQLDVALLATPAPEAAREGCTCATIDPGYGEGYERSQEPDCPIHPITLGQVTELMTRLAGDRRHEYTPAPTPPTTVQAEDEQTTPADRTVPVSSLWRSTELLAEREAEVVGLRKIVTRVETLYRDGRRLAGVHFLGAPFPAAVTLVDLAEALGLPAPIDDDDEIPATVQADECTEDTTCPVHGHVFHTVPLEFQPDNATVQADRDAR